MAQLDCSRGSEASGTHLSRESLPTRGFSEHCVSLLVRSERPAKWPSPLATGGRTIESNGRPTAFGLVNGQQGWRGQSSPAEEIRQPACGPVLTQPASVHSRIAGRNCSKVSACCLRKECIFIQIYASLASQKFSWSFLLGTKNMYCQIRWVDTALINQPISMFLSRLLKSGHVPWGFKCLFKLIVIFRVLEAHRYERYPELLIFRST